jgi:hypothetical protein
MNINKAVLLFIIGFCFHPDESFAQLSTGGKPKAFTSSLSQSIPTFTTPLFDVEALNLEDETLNQKGYGPYRFGKNFSVNLNPANTGIWSTFPNGDRLWQLEIFSPNAYSINLQFSYYKLPPEATMYIYNESKTMVLGAFTDINNQEDGLFATDLVKGDKIMVEYFEPYQVKGLGAFNISTITHAYRNLFSDEFNRDFGTSGNCQNNVACPIASGWEDQIRSTVMLVSGGNGFCSGALINNTAMDGRPYVLTANHCGSDGFGSWVFRFNWQADSCANPANSPSYQSLSGAVQRASYIGSDMSLVEITGGLNGGTIPSAYQAYFSGWFNLNIPADSAFCIHHPDGDIKKFSKAKNATQSSTMSLATCWRVGQWTSGCTEGGSSGSPLFDQNKRIVGQLYGGPSYCGAPASSMFDNFGKFYTSWLGGGTTNSQLKYWLDPSNSGLNMIDGYDPTNAPFNLDAAVINIISPSLNLNTCNTTLTPMITVKNNGIDTITSLSIIFTLDNAGPSTFNWTGILSSGQTDTITLTDLTALTFGNHTLVIQVVNPNNGTDMFLGNNQRQVSFTINNPNPLVNIPVYQGAENSLFPGDNWTILNPDNNVTWTASTNASGFGTSTKCFKMDNFSSDITNQSDYLVSPYLDFSASLAPLRINFNVAYARRSTLFASDSLIITVSSNCGETWTRIYGKGNMSLSTVGNTVQTSSFIPSTSQWKNETVNLNPYIGNDHVQIRFQNKSNFGNNLYLDDIQIANSFAQINEINKETGFTIMPNPAKSQFKVYLPSNELINEISIVNAIGEEVYQNNKINANALDININLPNGIYFVKVKINQSQTIQKLVINN